jgi:hypothetical protein
MPWIRLSDDYLGDEKISALSHGGFRLWHEGLAHCRRHQTDGLIPFSIMRQLPTFSKSREKELATPLREDMAPLWELIPKMGYKVHNYLEWNPSKDWEQERRAESKARMRGWRDRRETKGTPQTAALVTQVLQRNRPVTNAFVLGEGKDLTGSSSERESERKPTALSIEERASRLREELYPAWFEKYRNGAKLNIPLIANSLEFQSALSLVSTWDDVRLEKLARIVLTTNEDFIAGTDRGFKIFAMKASWADDRLRQSEAKSS